MLVMSSIAPHFQLAGSREHFRITQTTHTHTHMNTPSLSLSVLQLHMAGIWIRQGFESETIFGQSSSEVSFEKDCMFEANWSQRGCPSLQIRKLVNT